jgi:hypothetical protein
MEGSSPSPPQALSHVGMPSLNFVSVVRRQCACWLSPKTYSGMATFREITLEDDDLDDKLSWFQTSAWQVLRGGFLAVQVGLLLAGDRMKQGVVANQVRGVFGVRFLALILVAILTDPRLLKRLQLYVSYSLKVLNALRDTFKLHSSATDDTVTAFAQALKDGRAQESQDYTLYWPDEEPNEDYSDKTLTKSKATKLLLILYLPGFGVSPVAYAPPARQLLHQANQRRLLTKASMKATATQGKIAGIAIVATDPLRVPSPMLGYDASVKLLSPCASSGDCN